MSALITTLAERYGVEPDQIADALRQTMPRDITDIEFLSCCAIAYEQQLNPLMKEIKFDRGPDQAVHTIVLIDGWIKKCNAHEQYDGIEFDDKFGEGGIVAVKATIFRKDRRPTSVTEYLAECRRDTDNWKTMPARNLRWRALAQCARVTFGFAGMDADEFAQWQDRARPLPAPQRRTAEVSKPAPQDDLELPDLPDGSEAVSAAPAVPETDLQFDADFLHSFTSSVEAQRGDSVLLREVYEAYGDEIGARGLEQVCNDIVDKAVNGSTEAAAPEADAADIGLPPETAETQAETAAETERAPAKPAHLSDTAATMAVKGLELRLSKLHNATLIKDAWRTFGTIFDQMGPDAKALATRAKEQALARVKKSLQAAE